MKKSTLLKKFDSNVKHYIKSFEAFQKSMLEYEQKRLAQGDTTQRKLNNFIKRQAQEKEYFLADLQNIRNRYAFAQSLTFSTEWTKGGVYGQQAKTTFRNDFERLESGFSSGCGYNKHSHSIEIAVKDSRVMKFIALSTLPKERIKYNRLLSSIGGGVSCLKEFLASANYKCVSENETKYSDFLHFELKPLKD